MPSHRPACLRLPRVYLQRLKAAGVRTTACVDLVAASGGYMLACAAHNVLAAPFSIVGSIGVIAGAPNVARLLERQGIDVVQRTAGAYKVPSQHDNSISNLVCSCAH